MRPWQMLQCIVPTALTSDTAVDGVLEQLIEGRWQPLVFFSKHLRPPKLKYSAFDRELLALYLAIRHFRYFLEGRPFTAFTDHKLLTFAFTKVSDPWSACQQQHLSYISEYTMDIQHVSGKDNVVADALSRPAIQALSQGVDYAALAEAQQGDAEMPSFRTAVLGLQLQDFLVGLGEKTLLCDVATSQPRPIVPAAWQWQVFNSIHGLVHPSIRTTVRLVSSKFAWHGLCKQVSKWTGTCTQCQTANVQRHTKAPRTFDHIHVDIGGPLPVSQGARYLLTMVDRFTRLPEAVLLTDTSADSCARVLIATWGACFGVPANITSNRGAQFISSLWSAVASLLGTQLTPHNCLRPTVEQTSGTLPPLLEVSSHGPPERT
ncbi:trafficking protein particle complex subunit 2 isoform X1 [Hypanus sabinus]|uniref:trafficking protein particle complex subunit 2 isoform X1 n=1 Tax=Hypanus sabinus TaxID=79690 RepID=UPI0028C4330A|nr:trafficking protein particle complex subunit 2 isoform X1 [Hypanus sabinus]